MAQEMWVIKYEIEKCERKNCESNKTESKKCEIKKSESKIWVKNVSKNSERKYVRVKYE